MLGSSFVVVELVRLDVYNSDVGYGPCSRIQGRSLHEESHIHVYGIVYLLRRAARLQNVDYLRQAYIWDGERGLGTADVHSGV